MERANIRETPEFAAAVYMVQAGKYLAALGQEKMDHLTTMSLLAAARAEIEALKKPPAPAD
jgi:hypothetical protein